MWLLSLRQPLVTEGTAATPALDQVAYCVRTEDGVHDSRVTYIPSKR